MVKLLKSSFALFSRTQTNILSAASVIMAAVFLSRILGLARDRLLAARFSPDDLGVYYAAFRLPNMIFELLVMGALATAFIPVFTAYLDTKGKQEAFKMATSAINIGLIFFILFSFFFGYYLFFQRVYFSACARFYREPATTDGLFYQNYGIGSSFSFD